MSTPPDPTSPEPTPPARLSPGPAPEPGPAAIERGRRLFAGPVAFLRGVTSLDALPDADRVEVAFAGRSNVGKSSLINALTGRRSLARSSSTPGRTREINYFDLGGSVYLVDLPGYGFAKAPKALARRWQELMRGYLAGRPSLRRAFVLIDARHGVKAVDEEIMALLDRTAVPFQIVLTKTDKARPAELEAARRRTADAIGRHPAAMTNWIETSAVRGEGIPLLRAEIASL